MMIIFNNAINKTKIQYYFFTHQTIRLKCRIDLVYKKLYQKQNSRKYNLCSFDKKDHII